MYCIVCVLLTQHLFGTHRTLFNPLSLEWRANRYKTRWCSSGLYQEWMKTWDPQTLKKSLLNPNLCILKVIAHQILLLSAAPLGVARSINCPITPTLCTAFLRDLPPTILPTSFVQHIHSPPPPLLCACRPFLLCLFNFVFVKVRSLSRLMYSFLQREICTSSFCLQLHHFNIIHQSRSLPTYKPSLSSLLPFFCHKLLLTLISTHSVHCLGW